mmetsp:Transcript_31631/g.72399  ORF Transcript_31631/g.72399 Transcript_31631/m.72399 type:complete len:505 (+) Transcript_31631:21-1535(+)
MALELVGLHTLDDMRELMNTLREDEVDAKCDQMVAELRRDDESANCVLHEKAYSSMKTMLKTLLARAREGQPHEDNMYENLKCPITCELLHNPVVLPNGQVYSKEAIEEWRSRGNELDPMTRQPFPQGEAYRCFVLENLVEEWKKQAKLEVPKKVPNGRHSVVMSPGSTEESLGHTAECSARDGTTDNTGGRPTGTDTADELAASTKAMDLGCQSFGPRDVPTDQCARVILVERLDENSLVSFDGGLQVYAPHTQNVNADMFDVELLRKPASAISECFWIRASESIAFPIRLRLPLLTQSCSQMAAPYQVCRIDDADIESCEGGYQCSENATIEVVHEHVWRSKESHSKEYIEVKLTHLCAIFVRMANVNDSISERPSGGFFIVLKNETGKHGRLLIQNAASSVSSAVSVGVSQTNAKHERSSQPSGGLSSVDEFDFPVDETKRLLLQEMGPLAARDPISKFLVLHKGDWRVASSVNLSSTQVGPIVIPKVKDEVLDALPPATW